MKTDQANRARMMKSLDYGIDDMVKRMQGWWWCPGCRILWKDMDAANAIWMPVFTRGWGVFKDWGTYVCAECAVAK